MYFTLQSCTDTIVIKNMTFTTPWEGNADGESVIKFMAALTQDQQSVYGK